MPHTNCLSIPAIFQALLFILRLLIGGTVVKVGYTLATESLPFGYHPFPGPASGLFVIGVGMYFLFLAFSFLDKNQPRLPKFQ